MLKFLVHVYLLMFGNNLILECYQKEHGVRRHFLVFDSCPHALSLFEGNIQDNNNK